VTKAEKTLEMVNDNFAAKTKTFLYAKLSFHHITRSTQGHSLCHKNLSTTVVQITNLLQRI